MRELLESPEARVEGNLCFGRTVPPVSLRGRASVPVQQSERHGRCGQIHRSDAASRRKAPHLQGAYWEGGGNGSLLNGRVEGNGFLLRFWATLSRIKRG